MNVQTVLILVVSWVVFGAIVGLLARAIMPGNNAMGWFPTIGLGVLGSFVGGAIGNMISGGERAAFLIQPAGWIGSLVGALVVLAAFTLVTRWRAHG